MATDTFLDLLAPSAMRVPSSPKRKILPSIPPAPSASVPAVDDVPPPNTRPDFADDIDRIVRELECDGLIVFDGEAQCYRRPNVRRWRFA